MSSQKRTVMYPVARQKPGLENAAAAAAVAGYAHLYLLPFNGFFFLNYSALGDRRTATRRAAVPELICYSLLCWAPGEKCFRQNLNRLPGSYTLLILISLLNSSTEFFHTRRRWWEKGGGCVRYGEALTFWCTEIYNSLCSQRERERAAIAEAIENQIWRPRATTFGLNGCGISRSGWLAGCSLSLSDVLGYGDS